jgi:hypothetical protein
LVRAWVQRQSEEINFPKARTHPREPILSVRVIHDKGSCGQWKALPMADLLDFGPEVVFGTNAKKQIAAFRGGDLARYRSAIASLRVDARNGKWPAKIASGKVAGLSTSSAVSATFESFGVSITHVFFSTILFVSDVRIDNCDPQNRHNNSVKISDISVDTDSSDQGIVIFISDYLSKLRGDIIAFARNAAASAIMSSVFLILEVVKAWRVILRRADSNYGKKRAKNSEKSVIANKLQLVEVRSGNDVQEAVWNNTKIQMFTYTSIIGALTASLNEGWKTSASPVRVLLFSNKGELEVFYRNEIKGSEIRLPQYKADLTGMVKVTTPNFQIPEAIGKGSGVNIVTAIKVATAAVYERGTSVGSCGVGRWPALDTGVSTVDPVLFVTPNESVVELR